MSTIRGGRICVNVNGENGNYFKTHRGLRQGDPLSPLLFNLTTDALDHILTKAKTKGRIKWGSTKSGRRGDYTPTVRRRHRNLDGE